MHKETSSWSEDISLGPREWATIEGGGTYSTVKCLGCDSIGYLTETWFSEDSDPETGLPYTQTKTYPPTMARHHPKWFKTDLNLPSALRELLREIYVAYQNEGLRLCALGVRALIEEIMIAKIGDRGNLNGNIEAFLTAGHVAEQDHKLFKEKIIEIGNAAMHRGYNPTAQDVETLLSITESLIASIYTHPYRVGQMAQSMPPRISREKAPPLSQPRNF